MFEILEHLPYLLGSKANNCCLNNYIVSKQTSIDYVEKWLFMCLSYNLYVCFFYPATQQWRGIMVSCWLSVCPSVYSFLDDNLSICQWIFTKLGVCIDIVEIGLGLLMANFVNFLTELSACNRSVFSFPDDNFSKCKWVFTKLGGCIDIVEICFGIGDWWISSIFDRVICPQHVHIFISGW